MWLIDVLFGRGLHWKTHMNRSQNRECALLSLEDAESCLIEATQSRWKQHLRKLGPAHSFSGCLLFVASLNNAALCTSDSVSAVALGWSGLPRPSSWGVGSWESQQGWPRGSQPEPCRAERDHWPRDTAFLPLELHSYKLQMWTRAELSKKDYLCFSLLDDEHADRHSTQHIWE